MVDDLFSPESLPESIQQVSEEAYLLIGFARDEANDLMLSIESITSESPFRHMKTPGGKPMSVAMTNCGSYGWVSDQTGYRYSHHDPETDQAWPEMPKCFTSLASRAAAEAGYDQFASDACLINQYSTTARMTLHQDKDEQDQTLPIVSVSLGLSSVFLFGGFSRSDAKQKIRLNHGDVFVWGGVDRQRFHGIQKIDLSKGDTHPLTGAFRYNLTFRRARD